MSNNNLSGNLIFQVGDFILTNNGEMGQIKEIVMAGSDIGAYEVRMVWGEVKGVNPSCAVKLNINVEENNG